MHPASSVVSTPVVDAILKRRSIRSGFAERPLDRTHLEEILRCGLAAPSSKNARPWRFHVIEDAATRAGIADAVATSEDIDEYVPHDPATGRPQQHWTSTVLKSAQVLRDAAAAVVIENRGVFGGGRRSLLAAAPEAFAGSLSAYTFEVLGLGAAIQNMWLAANSLGVAAAFIREHNKAEHQIKQFCGLEGDLVGVLAFGYAPLTAGPRLEPPRHTQTEEPITWR
jgi:nitroreductase